ncbi:MAG: hypothetical protein NT154_04405 [Verrucomicrobia bacterium]|nr:hypothetical protein [Verrucomicrobiota bacterium]
MSLASVNHCSQLDGGVVASDVLFIQFSFGGKARQSAADFISLSPSRAQLHAERNGPLRKTATAEHLERLPAFWSIGLGQLKRASAWWPIEE